MACMVTKRVSSPVSHAAACVCLVCVAFQDRTPGTVAYMIGLGARQAYWWYQRQLWDDLPGSEALVRDALQQQVEFAASKPSADAGSESAGAVADDEAVHVGVRVVERPASEGESKTDVTHSSPGLLSAIPSSTLARVTDDQTHSPASVKLRVSTRNASQVQRLLQTVELRVPSPVHLVSPPAGRIMEPQTCVVVVAVVVVVVVVVS